MAAKPPPSVSCPTPPLPTRHGARTPLGQRYWRELGPVWDVCGTSQHSVPIEVVREDGGGPRPPNPDDDKQV